MIAHFRFRAVSEAVAPAHVVGVERKLSRKPVENGAHVVVDVVFRILLQRNAVKIDLIGSAADKRFPRRPFRRKHGGLFPAEFQERQKDKQPFSVQFFDLFILADIKIPKAPCRRVREICDPDFF